MMLGIVLCIMTLSALDNAIAEQVWEKEIGSGMYESKGVSKIEKLSTRYMLTTYCKGMHSIYIKDTKKVNLDSYIDHFVRVRYSRIAEQRFDVQCVKVPCAPIYEANIVIQDLEEIAVSIEELAHYQTSCTAVDPPAR